MSKLSSAGRRVLQPALLLWVSGVCLLGCGGPSQEGEPYPQEKVVELLRRSALDPNTFHQAEALREVVRLAEPHVGDSRPARRAYLAGLGALSALEAADGKPAQQASLVRLRRQRMEEFLRDDPGDGSVRGLLAETLVQERREREAWELLARGALAVDDSEGEQELLRSLQSLVSQENLRRDKGTHPQRLQEALAIVRTLSGRDRKRSTADRISLLGFEASTLIGLEDRTGVAAVLDRMRAVSPADPFLARLEGLVSTLGRGR